jgi:putative (di)nucleoside polyphosphate hydrolase
VTDYIDKDGFRANVGIVLTRGSGEVFLGGRVGGRGWQFPQGGVNRGERVEDALYRELKEEIGCAIACRANTCATAASARSSAGFC